MTQIDPTKVGCPEDPSSRVACFAVHPCFQFVGVSTLVDLLIARGGIGVNDTFNCHHNFQLF